MNVLGMQEEFSMEGGSGGSQRRVQHGMSGNHIRVLMEQDRHW